MLVLCCRYLNTQFIKKQKWTDADVNYGGFGADIGEQMLEIGEVMMMKAMLYLREDVHCYSVVFVIPLVALVQFIIARYTQILTRLRGAKV